MRRRWATTLVFALAVVMAMVVAASQRTTSPTGFTELHRAKLADAGSIEIVMGIIERDEESRSGRHHHPGGEFGFVLSGTVVVTTKDEPGLKKLQRTLGRNPSQSVGRLWSLILGGNHGKRN